ncbi:hypothetical protein VUR80DRAFT_8315 [Thermomyces stellatus]
MGSPFTDDEKRFVLTELIKASKTEMQPLVEFVKANCLSYSWFSVQLPAGRTVDDCIQATEKMLRAPVPPQSLKRETSSRPLPTGSPAPSPQPKPAEPATAPSIPSLLSAPATSQPSMPHVPIQPRPVNGTSHPPPTSPVEPPVKKRRGRPSRRQNLRWGGSNLSPRPLQPLAPQPTISPSPVVPAAESMRTLGNVVGEARGQKRARGSSDETVQSSASIGIMPSQADAVKEIKAEGSRATPPKRSSPVACSVSDGAEDGNEP